MTVEKLQEEPVEQEEQETQDTDAPEETVEDTEDSAEPEEQEQTESDDSDDGYEEEVLKQYSVPHKKVKDLATDYLSMASKLAFYEKFQPKLQKEDEQEQPQGFPFAQTPKPKQQQPMFTEKPVSEVVKNLIANGEIGKEAEPQYRYIANMVDSALSPQLNQVQEFMYQAAAVINKQQQMLRDMSWQSLNHPHKDKVQRDILDKLMGQSGIGNYGDALNFYIMQTNPSLLADLANKAREEGKKEGFKKLKRLKVNRRGAPAQAPSLKKYTDRFGNIDQAKLLADFNGDELKASQFLDKLSR